MADISKCQDKLIILAEKQGYLTFDDILNAADAFSLSVTEVDILSEAIQIRGILVYETAPHGQIGAQDDEELTDYSRTDYDAIYRDILDSAPQLELLIEEIKYLPTPQHGEVNRLAKQIAAGNTFARERLIKLYMRNVLKISLYMAKQYDLDLEETISTGFIGLMNAVDRYNPSDFYAFGPHAGFGFRKQFRGIVIQFGLIIIFLVITRKKCLDRCRNMNSIQWVKNSIHKNMMI